MPEPLEHGVLKCEGVFFSWRVWLALSELQLGTSLSNLYYSFQLPHWQGGVPAAFPPGGGRTEHLGIIASPLHLANRRFLAGTWGEGCRMRSPEMEVMGSYLKG